MEERQQLLLLKRQEEEDRLQQESADAMRMERMQLRRKELKIRVQEEEHEEQLEGGMMVSLLENYVREEEAELWDLANLSVEESPERQHIVVWGGLRRAAEKKHEILTKELQERHDKFAENLREKVRRLDHAGSALANWSSPVNDRHPASMTRKLCGLADSVVAYAG